MKESDFQALLKKIRIPEPKEHVMSKAAKAEDFTDLEARIYASEMSNHFYEYDRQLTCREQTPTDNRTRSRQEPKKTPPMPEDKGLEMWSVLNNNMKNVLAVQKYVYTAMIAHLDRRSSYDR